MDTRKYPSSQRLYHQNFHLLVCVNSNLIINTNLMVITRDTVSNSKHSYSPPSEF